MVQSLAHRAVTGALLLVMLSKGREFSIFFLLSIDHFVVLHGVCRCFFSFTVGLILLLRNTQVKLTDKMLLSQVFPVRKFLV